MTSWQTSQGRFIVHQTRGLKTKSNSFLLLSARLGLIENQTLWLSIAKHILIEWQIALCTQTEMNAFPYDNFFVSKGRNKQSA
jgi:hypothetical protein